MRPLWLEDPVPEPDATARSAARRRQNRLTKPPGSLGVLEEMAIRLAALQRSPTPTADRLRVVVFAADHGISAAGVSAYPVEVTAEMVRNFSRGGAAISVLARQLDAPLEVVDVGVVTDPGPLPGVTSQRVGPGTQDFRFDAAMRKTQLPPALEAGRAAASRAKAAGTDLLILGEMGISNTTSASALSAALLGLSPDALVGPGTGVDAGGIRRKCDVIRAALDNHQAERCGPYRLLRIFGGFEIAALVGCYIAAAQRRLPVLVDGFIASAAALAATRLNPGIAHWLIYTHESAEPGHRALLRSLHAHPILSLGMRLGEGSGAAVAAPLLRSACALHNEMATFEEAGVSEA